MGALTDFMANLLCTSYAFWSCIVPSQNATNYLTICHGWPILKRMTSDLQSLKAAPQSYCTLVNLIHAWYTNQCNGLGYFQLPSKQRFVETTLYMGQKASKKQRKHWESRTNICFGVWSLEVKIPEVRRGRLVLSKIVGRSQNIERGVETTLRGVKLLVFRATKVHNAHVHL